MAARLGQLLIASHIITEVQLREALDLQRREGGRIGTNLVKLGYVTEEKLVAFLSRQYNVPAINLSDYKVDPSLLKLIPVDMARKYLIMPVARVGATLTVAMVDPSNVFAIDDVKFRTGYNVEVGGRGDLSMVDAMSNQYSGNGEALVTAKEGEKTNGFQAETSAFAETFQTEDYTTREEEFSEGGANAAHDGPMVDIDEFDKLVGDALDSIEIVTEKKELSSKEIEEPIVKLVNGILMRAIKGGASDIHIEPYERSLRVRYRVDGIFFNAMNLPIKIKGAVTSRLKIMARLDIAERRLPQDGRIKLRLGKKKEIDFRVSVLPCLFGEKTVLRILDKSNLQVDLTKLGFEEDILQSFMDALNKPYGMILVTGPTGSGKTTTLYSGLNYLNKPGINIKTGEDPIEYNFLGINQVQMKEEIGLTFASALRSFLRQSPDIILVGEIRDFETAEIAVKAALTGHLVLSTLHTNDAPSSVSRLLNMGIEPFLISASVILIMAQRLIRKMVLEGASADEIKKTAIRLGMKNLRMSGLTKIKEGITSMEEVFRITFG